MTDSTEATLRFDASGQRYEMRPARVIGRAADDPEASVRVTYAGPRSAICLSVSRVDSDLALALLNLDLGRLKQAALNEAPRDRFILVHT